MRVYFEQIDPLPHSSLVCREYIQPHFDSPYHLHPEYELTYIQASYGKRMIGSHLSNYATGELVLVGKNVPHCWSDEAVSGEPAKPVHSIVIQFGEDFLGKGFLDRPELVQIRRLLDRAGQVVAFHPDISREAAAKMADLVRAAPFRKLIGFLELLQELAICQEYELLMNTQYTGALSQGDCRRIHAIYAYVHQHFREVISLQAVADLVCLTPSAFCRYFKRITNKTLVQLVTEYRLMHAGTLLLQTNQSVSEIAFACGFGNLSNFNKHFRQFMNMTPLAYRMQASRLQAHTQSERFIIA